MSVSQDVLPDGLRHGSSLKKLFGTADSPARHSGRRLTVRPRAPCSGPTGRSKKGREALLREVAARRCLAKQLLKAQYQEAIAREVELKRTQRPYTHADFEFVASGKSAMSLAATLGMSVLANRKNCVRTDLDHIYDDARWRLADV